MNPPATVPEGLGSPLPGESVRLRAAGLADASGFSAVPGSMLIRADGPGRLAVLAAGSEAEVAGHPESAKARAVDLGRSVVLPALVNAHTHLDLTHIGPRRFDASAGFVGWVDMVRRERLADADAIGRSVRAGVALGREGGVAAVGDIAGCPSSGPQAAGAMELARSGMRGVSFVEFFGIGRGRERGLPEAIRAIEAVSGGVAAEAGEPGVRLGLQPHAPGTVSLRVYEGALAVRGRALSTHLAETPEEHEFIATGRGPQRDLLERVGAWDDMILEEVGKGLTPVVHMAGVLAGAMGRDRREPILLVHVNDCGDEDLETLASVRRSGVNLFVIYCPRASAYFRAADTFGPHRYKEMLARGIPVALGTDSVINLSAEDLAQGISTWGEMRLLNQRDGVDPAVVLAMATTMGASALGFSPEVFLFARSGPIAGLIAVETGELRPDDDPIRAALISGNPAKFLFNNNESCLAET